jgi:hypothetical protein
MGPGKHQVLIQIPGPVTEVVELGPRDQMYVLAFTLHLAPPPSPMGLSLVDRGRIIIIITRFQSED